MRRSVGGLTGVVLAVGLAACSAGGGSGTAAPDDGSTGGAATPPPAAATVAPTDAAAMASAPVVPSIDAGGGVSTGGVCDLVTASEMETIFETTGVTQGVIAGPPDTCEFKGPGGTFAAMVLIPTGGMASFSAYSYEQGAEPIGGLGDEALYSPSTQLVIIRKGDAVVSIAVYGTDYSDAKKLELLKAIGGIAAGRL